MWVDVFVLLFIVVCYVYPLVDQLPVRSPTSKGRESMESGGVKYDTFFIILVCPTPFHKNIR